jgi:hypothetical protein
MKILNFELSVKLGEFPIVGSPMEWKCDLFTKEPVTGLQL